MKAYKITVNTINCEWRVDGKKVIGYFATKELGNKAIKEIENKKFFYNLYETDRERKKLVTNWEEIEIVEE